MLDKQRDIWDEAKQNEYRYSHQLDGIPQVACFILMNLLVIELNVGFEGDLGNVADQSGKLTHQLFILRARRFE